MRFDLTFEISDADWELNYAMKLSDPAEAEYAMNVARDAIKAAFKLSRGIGVEV